MFFTVFMSIIGKKTNIDLPSLLLAVFLPLVLVLFISGFLYHMKIKIKTTNLYKTVFYSLNITSKKNPPQT